MVLDPDGWAPLGPSVVYNGQIGLASLPVSGRVTAIAIDPVDFDNVIYVGTALGGVWKTKDGGQTWRPLTDDHLSLAVGAMAIDKNPPHHLYVASGESNIATDVFRGTGMTIYDPVLDTWAFKNDTSTLLTNVMSSAIIVDSRSAPNIRILIGTDNGLIESNDNGETWHLLLMFPLPVPQPRVTDVVLNAGATVNEDRLYVALEFDGVYRKDGTEEFKPLHGKIRGQLPLVADVRRITLAMCPDRDHRKRLYALYARRNGSVKGIYVTDDGGNTWERAGNAPRSIQANYNAVLAVHPTDPDRVFFGEEDLWRSKTAGARWTRVSKTIHVDQHAMAFHPKDPDNKIWAGNDGGVWFSSDGGNTWQSRNRGLQTMQYYSVAQHPDEESILLAGAQDNGVQRFEGHPAWNQVDDGDGFFCAIDSDKPSHWYASYVFEDDQGGVRAISRSDDAGDKGSWSLIVNGIGNSDTDPDPFYVPFVLDPSNSEVLYLGTSKLYRTTNRGVEWTPVINASDRTEFKTGNRPEQTITAICVHPGDPATVYVGTFDGQFWRLRREDDAKGIYTVIKLSPVLPLPAVSLPAKYIADIAVPAGAPASDRVYVAIGSDHDPQLPNIKPETDRLFRSDDRGLTWKTLNSGLDLPPIQGVPIPHHANPVNAIVLDPDNPTHVYIGCDIGVFKSTESGDSWTQFSENLPNCAIADLQLHNKKRLLRAATIGRSIWERRLDPPPVSPRAGLYVRHNLLDMGRSTTPEDGVINPLDPDETLQWYSSADIIVDTPFGRREFQKPKSTMTYTDGGDIDYIGFAQLKHYDPRSGTQSRVYVEAINRGPDDANGVAVRVFYAAKVGDDFPDLPADFWTAFPDDDPVAPSAWKPLGPKKLITKPLRPAEPQIVQWNWDVPASLTGKAALLAVITGNEDRLNEALLDVGKVARENNHVALRQVNVETPAASIVATILTVIRLAVEVADAIED